MSRHITSERPAAIDPSSPPGRRIRPSGAPYDKRTAKSPSGRRLLRDRGFGQERDADAEIARSAVVLGGPGPRGRRGELPLGRRELGLPRGTNASSGAGSVRTASSGNRAASARGPVIGNGRAPLDGTVAVLAHLPVVDEEGRPGDAGQPRRRPLPQERDGFLAKGQDLSLVGDVSLDRAHRSVGHLPSGDGEDDWALSAETIDEVTGQLPAGSLDGLHLGPVAGDLGRGGSPPETEDHLDSGEGHADLTGRRHQASLIQLSGLVPATARVGVDAGRPEATEVVIEWPRLGRQLRQSGDSPMLTRSTSGSLVVGRTPGDLTLRLRPG